MDPWPDPDGFFFYISMYILTKMRQGESPERENAETLGSTTEKSLLPAAERPLPKILNPREIHVG